MSDYNDPPLDDPENVLPIEIEFYIEPDGSVTFADLAAEIVPVAHSLNPDHPLACEVPPPSEERDVAARDASESDANA